MLLGFCIEARYDMGIIYSYDYSISLGYAGFAVPIAAVFPVCFVQRYLSREGTSRLILFRSSRRSYMLSNLFSTFLSGMIVMGVAFLLFSVISFFNCWPEGVVVDLGGDILSYIEYEGELVPGSTEVDYEQVGYFYCVMNDYGLYSSIPFFAAHHVIYYLVKGLLLMLQGGMYAMISLACYAFLQNQYIALVLPFLSWVALNFLGTTTKCFWLDPSQLHLTGVMSESTPYGGLVYFVVYIAVVFLLCAGMWGVRTMRRCQNA